MSGGAGRRAALAVQAAVTLAAVAALAWLVDWPGVVAALGRTDPAAMLAAVVLAALSQGLGAWRLSLILDGLGLRLGLRRCLAFTWAGLFSGNVLPATVGADALFAVLLGRSGFPVGSGVIGIVYNRAVNVAVVLLCLPAALAALRVEASVGGAWLAGADPAWLAAAAGVGTMAAAAAFAALRLARRRWPEAAGRAWTRGLRLLAELGGLVRRPALGAAAAALSVAMLGLGAAALLVLARTLVPDFSYATAWGLLVVVLAAQIAPLSINGLGVQEALFTVCLTQAAGWTVEDAVAFGLLVRLLTILVSLPGLPVAVRLLRRTPAPG